MHSEDLKALIRARFEHNIPRPLLILGAPGGGKTSLTKQVAAELEVEWVTLHVATMLVEDTSMPIINGKRDGVQFVVDAHLPMVGSKHAEKGILILDELSQGSVDIQKSLANLIQERELKGRRLRDGWMIVATGNRLTDRAGANRVLSHLMNRMTRVELAAHLDSWCNWYMDQPDCCIEGLYFLRFAPKHLDAFDPQQDVNPTARAWTEGVFASVGKIPQHLEHETWKGDVGDGPAAEFVSFLQIYRSLPNPDAVLMQPDTHPIPEAMNVKFALAGAIAQRATPDNFDRVLTVAKRIGPEFTVMIVMDAIKRDPNINRTKAFTKWAHTDGAKILS